MPFEFVLPLLSAAIYVVGALSLKRAADLGADVWRITCLCNWASALCFIPLTALGGVGGSWPQLWQPAVVGFLFLLGQLLAFFALRIGDVSVATPVLGLKIVLVALLTSIVLGERVSAPLWAAAALSSVAIALLNRSDQRVRGRTGATILLSGAAAAAYALFDVLVQKWSPSWGAGRFLPITMGMVALYSLAAVPLWKRDAEPATRIGFRRPLFVGAACLGLQSVLFVSTISLYGRATAANVLYSSRGLWSVLAVWLVGHWFGNREQHLGRRVLGYRVFGAALLLIAILLVLAN
jgi:drug/metabolite transporter (DMT)-like permease